MKTNDMKITQLRNHKLTGYWGERILAQLEYAAKLSKVDENRYEAILETAVNYLLKQAFEEDAITKEAVLKAEGMLVGISKAAKGYTMICAAHAHIDMNWMWGWNETVAVTLDTFRTMLDLLKEYPDFIFSQSQASIYKIVEQYAPDMLEHIKKRVKEGRWEVTASHWVEADKNMPSGESLSRHILYTKQYLSKLLDIDPASLNLDFEPDTFGHSVHVPEILANGGIKYYYHCRGYEGHNMYKWKAPSGKAVTVYREPIWYNAEIHPSMALYVPEFCEKYGMKAMLKVYGVGDHGGGPTRRDIERILDMNTWPIFPKIKFGTFAEFYSLVDQVADLLPTVEGELNFVFTGCYTSQSRIKMANRIGEAALNEAETFSSAAALSTGLTYRNEALAHAWENVLFNQFHDIIPGSGVVETREHAMGLFQNTMAAANSCRSLAMQSIASQIDTSRFICEEDSKETVSEGAGGGFGAKDFKVTHSERGRGKKRIFHIFNSSSAERGEAVEITIWDWKGNINSIVFKDDAGHFVDHQLLDQGFNHYWGHDFLRVLIQVKVPAYGYSTYMMSEAEYEIATPFPREPRVEKVDRFVLENDFVKAIFHTGDASIVSMIDKSNGEELVDSERLTGLFRFIEEDTDKGMTAWIVGRYMNITNLTENVKVRNVHYTSTKVRQSISYEIGFCSSTLKVVVSLDYNHPRIDYNVECDWHEIGKADKSIPQLGFHMPLGYECVSYKYDVPFGTIERQSMDRDVPGNSWTVGNRKEPAKKSVMLITDSKYGFRGHDNALNITLIRSSYDPDPYPELGIHKFKFAVSLVDNRTNKELIEYAYNYNHPLNVLSEPAHEGALPTINSFFKLEEGSVVVSTIKMQEFPADNHKLIIRVYETEGSRTKAVLHFARKAINAYYVDINEQKVNGELKVTVEKEKVSFNVLPFSVATLCVEF